MNTRDNHKRGPKPLTDWDSQPLGSVVDCEIARRLGCSNSTVAAQRKARGIPASGKPSLTDWDAQPLGEVSDCEIARRVGCHLMTVRYQRRKRGIPTASRPSFDALYPGLKERLGLEPDASLARDYSLSRQRIWQLRALFGILPADWRSLIVRLLTDVGCALSQNPTPAECEAAFARLVADRAVQGELL